MPLAVSDATLAPYVAQMQPQRQAAPEDERIGAWPYLALAGGQGADIAATWYALNRGDMKEANPVLSKLGPAGITGVKVGMAFTLGMLMRHLDKTGHDKAAKVIGAMAGAAGAVPAAMNVRTMRNTPRKDGR